MDKIHLLEHSEPIDAKPKYHGELKEDLDELGIEVSSVECDIFDLYSVLGKVAELISTHAEDQIYVNLSAGSKISAIGGMIACMITRSKTEVTPFYVRAQGYNSEQNAVMAPVSYGVDSISELPTYPIDGPSKAEILMLTEIANNDPLTKKHLIQRARAIVPRFQRYMADNNLEKTDNPEIGEYRLLETHVLEPLHSRGWIQISDVGRTKEVSITPAGGDTLRAFEYLIN